MMEDFARLLIKARREARMTQSDLAFATGIAQADISRMENGKGNPSLTTMDRLAEGLGKRLTVEFVEAEETE